jgi:nucleoid-associated protein YgaU
MGILERILGRKKDMASGGSTATPPIPWRTYLVARGDNLWKIAKREYGNANWWYEIFNANRRLIKSPDLVHPGMTLRLP